MITEHDLDEAIAECYGKRDQTPDDCVKLAAYMTIKDQLYGKPAAEPEQVGGYSYAAAREDHDRAIIELTGDDEFSRAANGMPVDQFCELMQELVEAVQVVNPRLYQHLLYKVYKK